MRRRRVSCSGSRRGRRCARVSSAPSPGTANRCMRWPEQRARTTFVAVAAALANVVVAAVVAAAYGHDGVGGLVAGLVLAPLGTLAAYAVAERMADGWFAAAAAVVYVALPLVAALFFVPAYRSTYKH